MYRKYARPLLKTGQRMLPFLSFANQVLFNERKIPFRKYQLARYAIGGYDALSGTYHPSGGYVSSNSRSVVSPQYQPQRVEKTILQSSNPRFMGTGTDTSKRDQMLYNRWLQQESSKPAWKPSEGLTGNQGVDMWNALKDALHYPTHPDIK